MSSGRVRTRAPRSDARSRPGSARRAALLDRRRRLGFRMTGMPAFSPTTAGRRSGRSWPSCGGCPLCRTRRRSCSRPERRRPQATTMATRTRARHRRRVRRRLQSPRRTATATDSRDEPRCGWAARVALPAISRRSAERSDRFRRRPCASGCGSGSSRCPGCQASRIASNRSPALSGSVSFR